MGVWAEGAGKKGAHSSPLRALGLKEENLQPSGRAAGAQELPETWRCRKARLCCGAHWDHRISQHLARWREAKPKQLML